MTSLPRRIKRLTVSIVGFPLLAVGIVLIPVPGPGLIVSLLALMILSSEFDWAKAGSKKAKNKIKEIYKEAKARADKIESLGEKSGKDDGTR